MPYRLIHDSDLDDVADAVRILRQHASNKANNDLLHLDVDHVSFAVAKMFERNGPACTQDEAFSAVCNKRMDSHFSGTLAKLYEYADGDNKQRLRAAFAHVFKDFA